MAEDNRIRCACGELPTMAEEDIGSIFQRCGVCGAPAGRECMPDGHSRIAWAPLGAPIKCTACGFELPASEYLNHRRHECPGPGNDALTTSLASIALELEIQNLLKHGTIEQLSEAESRRATRQRTPRGLRFVTQEELEARLARLVRDQNGWP